MKRYKSTTILGGRPPGKIVQCQSFKKDLFTTSILSYSCARAHMSILMEIKSILSNTNSDIYPDVSIRGIQGRVYHDKDTNRVVGIHTEGEFAGQIMKAQPISERQLEFLRELNILD